MDRAKNNKYKKIYQEKVLPKKTVTINTPDAYIHTVAIHKDFSVYRQRANEVVLGGKHCGQKE